MYIFSFLSLFLMCIFTAISFSRFFSVCLFCSNFFSLSFIIKHLYFSVLQSICPSVTVPFCLSVSASSSFCHLFLCNLFYCMFVVLSLWLSFYFSLSFCLFFFPSFCNLSPSFLLFALCYCLSVSLSFQLFTLCHLLFLSSRLLSIALICLSHCLSFHSPALTVY